MFRCQMCKTIVPAGQSANKLIVSRRAKIYAPRTKKFARARGYRSERIIDRGGSGHEIVRELMVCASCAASQADVEPVLISVPVAETEVEVVEEAVEASKE